MHQDTNCHLDLSGRLAVVSGSTRNIGRAVTLALLRAGCSVLAVYNQSDESAKELKLAAKSISPNGIKLGKLHLFQGDVSNQDTWEKIDDKTRAMGGTTYLINVVGDWHEGKLITTSIDTIDKLYQSNFRSMFLGCSYMTTQLSKSSGARIVNFTCAGAQKLEAKRATPAYFIFKHAVLSATLTFARELAGSGITVNAIAPGYTEWVNIPEEHMQQICSMIPAQRLGTAQDIVHALYTILDPDADYLTGTQIIVSCGLSI